MIRKISSLGYYKNLAPDYDRHAQVGLFPDVRLIFNAVSGIPEFRTIETVLDAGIGTGLASLPFARAGKRITGLDGSPEMLTLCLHKRFAEKLILTDLENPRFPDRTFDLTMSAGTLYLLSNSTRLLTEMIKATAPGGIIAFNYEPSPDDGRHARMNDAGKDSADLPVRVETYSVPRTEIASLFREHGFGKPLYQDAIPVAERPDGSFLTFETLIYRKAL